MDINIITDSARQTLNLGARIGRKLKEKDIICLFGQLGSGKTVLVKGIALGLGIVRDEVTSPSFVLLRQFQGRLSLNHFDLFRLESIEEILRLGFDEYVYSNNVSVIEWADRLDTYLPHEFLSVKLRIVGKDKRELILSSKGERYQRLLKNLRLA